QGARDPARALEVKSRGDVDATGAPLPLVRAVSPTRFVAARVVASNRDGARRYRVERAQASLLAGALAHRFFARPLLLATVLSLPLAIMFFLLAPSLLARRLRRAGAIVCDASRPVVLVPRAAGEALATAADDLDFGNVQIARGSTVALLAEPASP